MLRNTIKSRWAKKGDGLSLNVIVIAVIALLVLIVLIFMFTKGSGTFSRGVGSCMDDTGRNACVRADMSCEAGFAKVPSTCTLDGSSEGGYCCTKIG